MKERVLGIFILILIFFACKPYNSDLANKRLLQGTWMLIDTDHEDALNIQQDTDSTLLIFRNDTCIEYMSNTRKSAYFTFDVQNYILFIYRNDTLTNWVDIGGLVGDSLTLRRADKRLKYKKIEQY